MICTLFSIMQLIENAQAICLGSLFALYVLQTIEPANLLLRFTVFVNRVIEREQRERETGSVLIGKTPNTGGVSSLVSPLD